MQTFRPIWMTKTLITKRTIRAKTWKCATLDGIAGGAWWRGIATNSGKPFVERLTQFTSEYRKQMLSSFRLHRFPRNQIEVRTSSSKICSHFCDTTSRRSFLMNDGMCKARRDFLGKQFSKGFLFDFTPEKEVVDLEQLCNSIEALAREKGNLTRKSLRAKRCGSTLGDI